MPLPAAQFMRTMGVNASQLAGGWSVTLAQQVATGAVGGGGGRAPVVWEGAWGMASTGGANSTYVWPSSTVVQVWKDAATLHEVVRSGLRALQSAGWYVQSNSKWADFYTTEPLGLGPEKTAARQQPATGHERGQWAVPNDGPWTPAEEALVLGGGVSKWGCSGVCLDPVDTVEKFDGQVWPVACAVAERLWSPRNCTNTASALPRLESHRERLLQRGVYASAVH
jgi:hypothetical protein